MVAELEGATDLVDLTGRVKEVFGRYRADDRRSFLTRPEMQRMLNDLMPNTSYKLLDKLLKEIDGDGADGKFTTPEFVDWLVGKAGLPRQASGLYSERLSKPPAIPWERGSWRCSIGTTWMAVAS